MVARYAVRTEKVLETIVWLANAKPGIDIYHVVKCAFFADRYHLNKYGRPISGDNYIADTYGPLGNSIYKILNCDPIEMLALNGNGRLPIRVGDRWTVTAERSANSQILSKSDVEALQWAVEEVADLSFNELVAKTHADPAYIAAEGGRMKYEDFLDVDDPKRKEKAADLEATARYAVL